MKKLYIFIIFLALCIFSAFADETQPGNAEEIDFLLFQPNSSDIFINEERAAVQLDNLANYLKAKELVSGQIFVYGYAAYADNDIDEISLSRNRALFVMGQLQRRGVSRMLFSDPVAHGSVNLWGSNNDEEARVPNRRVRVLLDGTILTPVIVTPETIPEPIPEPEPVTAFFGIASEELYGTAITEEPKNKFPWWLLLPLLLIPLLFLLAKRKKSDTAKKPKEKIAPTAKPPVAAAPAPEPKPEPAPPPKPEPVPQPAPTPPPQSVPQPTPTPPAPTPSQSAAPQSAPQPTLAFEPTKGDMLMAASIRTGLSVVDLDEEIRKRAYEIFEQRGYEHGHADEHWYQAYPEVCARYEANNYKTNFDEDDWHWKAIKSFLESKKK